MHDNSHFASMDSPPRSAARLPRPVTGRLASLVVGKGLVTGLVLASVCAASWIGGAALAQALPESGESQVASESVWDALIDHGKTMHGQAGVEAAQFLKRHHPSQDANLPLVWLTENLDLAMLAKAEFPWAGKVPNDIFLNDVLPYAVLDETRENWRPAMHARAKKIVAGCTTATEAAQALNRELFNVINVHYNTGRKRPNQSPSESIQQSRATCSGLSILLVDACRSVGIPARVAGVASWADKRGNHTWVEIWDDGWHFTGADEYDKEGLNRGWFTNDAAQATPGSVEFAVWASSYASTGNHFPMVWAPSSTQVGGVDVTARYVPADVLAKKLAERDAAGDTNEADASEAVATSQTKHIRIFDKEGGQRLPVQVALYDGNKLIKAVVTKAGRSDLNDMPALEVETGKTYTLKFKFQQDTETLEWTPTADTPATVQWTWEGLQDKPLANAGSLTKEQAQAIVDAQWAAMAKKIAMDRRDQLKDQVIKDGDFEMRYLERTFGNAPDGEKSLWISMHGGGGTAPEVNDQQWRNQIQLYEPDEGIYIAPRAPTNTWNLWHQEHIDGLFDALVQTYVATHGVDPNKVYIMGYSAGGDGTFQMAPRMADRWAAASMMAGHPGDAQIESLYNLPFAIYMGGQDSAYDRNKHAAEWGEKLDALEAQNPEAYVHRVKIYPQYGHWMNREDAEVLPWLQSFTRNPWPKKVVWVQDDVLKERFYWLQVNLDEAKQNQKIVAVVEGKADAPVINIQADAAFKHLTLWLNDGLVDLDLPITVKVNGKTLHEGMVPRTEEAVTRSLEGRADPKQAATAVLDLAW